MYNLVMPYAKGFPTFRVSKALSLILAVLAFGSACYSVWWLRPLAHDGSRYVFQMLNLGTTYYDGYRYLHGIFQLPAVLLSEFGSFSPLTLTRVYFFTLVLPVFGFLIYHITRSQRMHDLIIPLTLLLIGYLPGNSFLINSMFETSFFFYLMLRSEKKIQYYVFGLLAALGHSSIIIGFLLLIGFLLIEKYSRHKQVPATDFIFLSALTVLSAFLTVKMMFHIPVAAGKFVEVITSYLTNFTSERYLSSNICILFLLLLYSNFLNNRYRKIVQPLLAVTAVLLVICIRDPIVIHTNSFDYRIFILVTIIGLLPVIWVARKDYRLEVTFLTWLTLMIVGSAYVIQDVRIGNEYRKLNSYFQNMKPEPGCYVHEVPGQVRSIATGMAYPFYKMIIDNEYELKYLVFPDRTMGMDPCHDFELRKNGIVIFNEFMWMSRNGKFKLPDFINRGNSL